MPFHLAFIISISMIFKACKKPYTIVRHSNSCHEEVFPLLRDDNGDFSMECISPIHGRSYVMSKRFDGRYVVSKGNGLSYSSRCYSALSKELNDDLWGLLKESSATRDFDIGVEVEQIGIRTNRMEYVLKLEEAEVRYDNNHLVTPFLLQYDVMCPYRITDYAFMSPDVKANALNTWDELNEYDFREKYMIAAYTLIKNLHILREHHILHNALHAQNYTWALELLDFEASRTDVHPYDNPEYEAWASVLADTEIIQTYEVINYIAWCFGENIDYAEIERIFKHFHIKEI